MEGRIHFRNSLQLLLLCALLLLFPLAAQAHGGAHDSHDVTKHESLDAAKHESHDVTHQAAPKQSQRESLVLQPSCPGGQGGACCCDRGNIQASGQPASFIPATALLAVIRWAPAKDERAPQLPFVALPHTLIDVAGPRAPPRSL
ncbi:MAG TPA: hypothetical protein VGP15_14975 [Burkholderiales bacterium]|jgi:hypothetical protein|nr:hypothetical protein [Burkholderiales bacterium]